MAGASDPLEDMLFSEVDEKAVSDLVGSLESQLAGQSNPAAPHTETRSAGVTGAANHHLGRMLPAQVDTILEQQQQQQGQHKAGVNQEPNCKALSSGKTVIPSSLSSIPPFEEASITSGTGVNASSSGLPSHGASNITTVSAPGAATAADPLKNHLTSTIRTAPAGIQSLNGNGGVAVNSPVNPAAPAGVGFPAAPAGAVTLVNNVVNSAVPSPTGAANSSLAGAPCASAPAFSAAQPGGPPDGSGTLTIALQRPPSHIAASVAQNGNGAPAPALVQQVARTGPPAAAVAQLANHRKGADGSDPPADSPAPSKIILPTQPCVVNSLVNPVGSPAPAVNPPASQPPSSAASSAPAASSPAPLAAAAAKPAVNITTVGVVRPGTPSPSAGMPASTQPQPLRPGVGATQRIVAPQLIVRPPQQTTIQLPPGFTIPPALVLPICNKISQSSAGESKGTSLYAKFAFLGMVLVRTEMGQLVMVPQQALAQAQAQAQAQAHISPRPAAPASGPTFRVTTTQRGWPSKAELAQLNCWTLVMRFKNKHGKSSESRTEAPGPQSPVSSPAIRPCPPVQAKIVQPPTPSASPALQVSSSVAPTKAAVVTAAVATTAAQQPLTVIAGGQNPPQAQPQPAPQPALAQQGAAPTALASAPPAPGASVEMQENVKKCKNFLATLIKLASHNSPSPETSRNVKALVQDLLASDAKIEPEEFTNRLQSELKSSPQPYLVPFLKKSLPALRQSLLNSQQSLMQTQQPLQQVKPAPGTPQAAAGTVPTIVAGPTVRVRHPNSVGNTVPSILPHAPGTAHTSHLAIKRAPGVQSSQVRMPMVITQTVRPQGTVGKAPTIQASKGPGGFAVQVSANQKNKLNDPGGGSFRIFFTRVLNLKAQNGPRPFIFEVCWSVGSRSAPGTCRESQWKRRSRRACCLGREPDEAVGSRRLHTEFIIMVRSPPGATDDDDINDVASMAGVNLNEESARILATNSDLVGTQIRSCKDEAFLPSGLLHKRILETAKKFGVTEVPAEAVNFISHATQERLRTVLEKVTIIAQHRMETYKDDEWYEQATDVRSQLKFFEQLERIEKQRKDEEEREILLKAAKSRSRQEDPEQARLKQKAKEMQQQELAQMRQRDANLTALAAIGPRKKRKLDSPGAAPPGAEVRAETVQNRQELRDEQ
ncbi:TAF4 factor, partial [Atractosteus spatula]|nr:TAF4 factor [Atractosteus spatula]